MDMEKKKPGLAIIIASKMKKGKKGDKEDSSEMKKEVGQELLDAIKDNDPVAVYDVVKNMISTCEMDSDEDSEEEEEDY